MTSVVVERFFNQPSAPVARAALEAAGIAAHLADEHVIGMNWLYARAIGGMRLMVADEDVADALAILASDGLDALAELPEWRLPPSRYECCEACGERLVAPPRWGRSLRVFGMWLWIPFVPLAVPVVACERYHCLGCGHSWR